MTAHEDKLEQPKETCGLMLTFKGGVGVKVNLKATKKEVIEKIQESLAVGRTDLVQLETANPDEQEVCMFDPKEIVIAMVKKEFVIGDRIVKAQLASPGAPPDGFRH